MRLSDVDTISHISLFLNEKDTVSSVWQYLFLLLHNTKSTYSNFAHAPVPTGPVFVASARFGTPSLCTGHAGILKGDVFAPDKHAAVLRPQNTRPKDRRVYTPLTGNPAWPVQGEGFQTGPTPRKQGPVGTGACAKFE